MHQEEDNNAKTLFKETQKEVENDLLTDNNADSSKKREETVNLPEQDNSIKEKLLTKIKIVSEQHLIPATNAASITNKAEKVKLLDKDHSNTDLSNKNPAKKHHSMAEVRSLRSKHPVVSDAISPIQSLTEIRNE